MAERNNVINDIIDSFNERSNIRGILVIGYNLAANQYPYSVIAGGLKTEFFDSLDLN